MAPAPLPIILVIDDDPDLLPAIKVWLEMRKLFVVLTANNGVQGLEICEHTLPNCIVVDMKMPELDGMHFMQAMRGDPRTAEVPMIMLTARDNAEDRFAGLALGADRYLTKPTEPYVLLAAIQEALAMTSAQRLANIERLAQEPQR